MKKIKKHLYCKENQTAVYADPSFAKIVGYLSKGEWLGQLKKAEKYAFIISNKITGYIRTGSYLEGSAGTIHFDNSSSSYQISL